MAGSTVSPPPASPTEGDDLCEIDIASVAMHSVTLFVCLCGLAGNGTVLRLIRLEDIAFLFLSLAVADFLFLLFALPSTLLFLVADMSCSTIVPFVYLSFLFQLPLSSYYWMLFCMMLFVAAMADSTPCQLPKRLRWMLLSALLWVLFTLFTVVPTVTSLCPTHEQEQCRVALISINSIILLLFAVPMVISSTILIKAMCGSQQLKKSVIIIFLTLLFNFLFNFWKFLQELGYTPVSSQLVFMFACINSSMKPLIYFLAETFWRDCYLGRCWMLCSVGSLRDSLRRAFEEPEENTAHSNDAAMDSVL